MSQTQTETQYRVKDGSKMIPRGTKTTGEQVREQVRNGGQGDLRRGLVVAKKHRSWNAQFLSITKELLPLLSMTQRRIGA